MNDKYVLEYNVLDGSWHIEQVSDMTRANVRIFFKGAKVSYIPLAFTDTYEDALEAKRLLIKAKLSPMSSNDTVN